MKEISSKRSGDKAAYQVKDSKESLIKIKIKPEKKEYFQEEVIKGVLKLTLKKDLPKFRLRLQL